ncbi:hypothetical protein HMN09_00980000 [Mycena chlorophos]|uniref:Uncharacterized protein n=1 Tax=Mycena chlorophos TaxID=658473 RepID=A0A8H6SJE1_MYCCL|nr:hypothetical protein HMN09_00980000 [Mycena chlorophos]
MAEYTPLMRLSPDEEEELKKHEYDLGEAKQARRRVLYSAIGAAFAVLLSLLVYLDPTLRYTAHGNALLSATDVETLLERVLPSPNLDEGHATMRKNRFKFPRMIFPEAMVRANAANPDELHFHGSSVVLSSSDSMIYHWTTNSSWPSCYLTGWVSPPERLLEGNKSYKATGDVTAIEVWRLQDVSGSYLRANGVSWNTRPARLSLMGTVNFTNRVEQEHLHHLDGQELKAPTPRLPCSGVTEITVELAFADSCVGCRLEFQQVFSMPPLG